MQCATSASRAWAGDDELDAGSEVYANTLGKLLAAASAVLQDTLDRFETISGRVTEHVLTRGNAADHELIVALQDFDRLQQEFAAFGDVISHCAAASNLTGPEVSRPSIGRDVINVITLSDLKDRFLMHLQYENADFAAPSSGIEQIF